MLNSKINGAGAVFFPFLRALAHDMAAPLTSALGYAQLNLESPGTPEEMLEDLQQIEESAQALRLHVAMLSRVSRYLPKESICPADTLLEDLRTLSRSLSQSAGNQLEWLEEPGAGEGVIKGNPWLLRATCLAFLGNLCRQADSEVRAHRQGDSLFLHFTAPDDSQAPWTPERPGSSELGERLASMLELGLEKGTLWRLSLPLLEST